MFPSFNSGKIGDWKNMFTEEQNQYFRSVFKSKMQNCTLEFVWDEQDKEETHSQKTNRTEEERTVNKATYRITWDGSQVDGFLQVVV